VAAVRDDPVDGAQRAPTASLIDLVDTMLRELPALVGDRVELFSLEMQRAGAALARIVALSAAALLLAFTAWLALWAMIVAMLLALGWHWASAQAVALLVNAAAAAWMLLRARALLHLLSLPATRRHLQLGRNDLGMRPSADHGGQRAQPNNDGPRPADARQPAAAS
jgi:uncharacterized membrane protein YqjE